MQQRLLAHVAPWFSYLRKALRNSVNSLAKVTFLTRKIVALVVLVLALVAVIYGISMGTVSAAKQETVLAGEIVLCIGIVRDGNDMQHVFFQRGGETLEQTLIADGKQWLVERGFTVEHRNCYDSWQKAADFLTDGRVTLPENATEQDFVQMLMQWKLQRQ